MTEKIVAIDLGTSHLTGIVGEKQLDGKFSILAYDTEDSTSSIRRGNVYNREYMTSHIKSLISKLESRLNGAWIEKVYVGVGGQSLRTIEHNESKEIDEVVTPDDVKELQRRCEMYIPGLLDVLDVVPPIFYLDGRRELKPESVACNHLEARYKLVVGRPSIRRDLLISIQGTPKEVAGIIVSPLSLADAMLSREEKELGCALVDFGAGVTTITIYKNGELLNLSVLPVGGNLITRDITTLQITEAEAETLKKKHGSAIIRKEEDGEKVPIERENLTKEIELNDLNAIVEARITEIVENVAVRIKEVIEPKSLGNGIVLAGCAANLKNLPELLKDKCKINVRFSAIRSGLVRGNDDIIGNPLYMTAVSIMLKGTEQCVNMPFMEQISADIEEESVRTKKKTKKTRSLEEQKEPDIFDQWKKQKEPGIFDQWKNKINGMFADV